MAKEAKERQRQAGGDKVSETARAVSSNLNEAVTDNQPIRTMQKAVNMAGRILLSKVEEQIAKEAEVRMKSGIKQSDPTANLPQGTEKKRNDTTAGQMAKKIVAESPPGTGSRSVEECQK